MRLDNCDALIQVYVENYSEGKKPSVLTDLYIRMQCLFEAAINGIKFLWEKISHSPQKVAPPQGQKWGDKTKNFLLGAKEQSTEDLAKAYFKAFKDPRTGIPEVVVARGGSFLAKAVNQYFTKDVENFINGAEKFYNSIFV